MTPAATRDVALDAANRLFTSVAASYADRAAVVVLRGVGWDGNEGVRAVRAQHGTVLAQEDGNNFQWSLAQGALAMASVDLVLRLKTSHPCS